MIIPIVLIITLCLFPVLVLVTITSHGGADGDADADDFSMTAIIFQIACTFVIMRPMVEVL